MHFIKNYLFFILLISITFNCFSQKNELENKGVLPVSIYNAIPNSINFNSSYFINKKLNLSNFEFFTINTLWMPEGYFNKPIYSFKNTYYEFVSESYQKANKNLELQKGFFNVNDLYKTRNKEGF
jgi:hypothetical protein